MAYKCEIVCDVCGDTVLTVLNRTVGKRTMERYAREDGWHYSKKDGWACTECCNKKALERAAKKVFSKSVLK